MQTEVIRGKVIRWLQARLAFALVQATNVCVRGSRTKWRSLGLEDEQLFLLINFIAGS